MEPASRPLTLAVSVQVSCSWRHVHPFQIVNVTLQVHHRFFQVVDLARHFDERSVDRQQYDNQFDDILEPCRRLAPVCN